MKREVADYGVVDRTVWMAHQIVVEGLLVAGQRFNPPQFEDAFAPLPSTSQNLGEGEQEDAATSFGDVSTHVS